ncbi:MAG: hypothetical protein QM682_13750 [Paracoccus sp. (in: a-proteobacteria)]
MARTETHLSAHAPEGPGLRQRLVALLLGLCSMFYRGLTTGGKG